MVARGQCANSMSGSPWHVEVEFPGWGMYYFDMEYCLSTKVLTNQ